MGGWVRVGPACSSLGQRFVPNERTLARAEGIETLRSTHKWVDTVDCRLFLMGFDAGEKYNILATARQNIPEEQQTPIVVGSCDQFSEVPDAGPDTNSRGEGTQEEESARRPKL